MRDRKEIEAAFEKVAECARVAERGEIAIVVELLLDIREILQPVMVDEPEPEDGLGDDYRAVRPGEKIVPGDQWFDAIDQEWVNEAGEGGAFDRTLKEERVIYGPLLFRRRKAR